jgi:hypothetical protein
MPTIAELETTREVQYRDPGDPEVKTRTEPAYAIPDSNGHEAVVFRAESFACEQHLETGHDVTCPACVNRVWGEAATAEHIKKAYGVELVL